MRKEGRREGAAEISRKSEKFHQIEKMRRNQCPSVKREKREKIEKIEEIRNQPIEGEG